MAHDAGERGYAAQLAPARGNHCSTVLPITPALMPASEYRCGHGTLDAESPCSGRRVSYVHLRAGLQRRGFGVDATEERASGFKRSPKLLHAGDAKHRRGEIGAAGGEVEQQEGSDDVHGQDGRAGGASALEITASIWPSRFACSATPRVAVGPARSSTTDATPRSTRSRDGGESSIAPHMDDDLVAVAEQALHGCRPCQRGEHRAIGRRGCAATTSGASPRRPSRAASCDHHPAGPR